MSTAVPDIYHVALGTSLQDLDVIQPIDFCSLSLPHCFPAFLITVHALIWMDFFLLSLYTCNYPYSPLLFFLHVLIKNYSVSFFSTNLFPERLNIINCLCCQIFPAQPVFLCPPEGDHDIFLPSFVNSIDHISFPLFPSLTLIKEKRPLFYSVCIFIM